jgi:DNA-binding MltR family transcriptional regulator
MLEKVTDIILALTKAIKAFQLYGIDHPSSKNFYTPLYQKLFEFLEENGELTFQIERFTIRYSNQIVYEETEKDINIAFKLFRDGIRSVGFTEGLASDELLRFLEIVSRPSEKQDIVLNLWESDFIHIHFYVVEEEDENVDYKAPSEPAQNVDYNTWIKDMMNKEKIDLTIPMRPDLSFDEIKTLKTEIIENEINPMTSTTINTLVNFLNIEKAKEVIESLIKLLEQCIQNRDFYNARIIVHSLLKYPDVSVIEKIENEKTISGFKKLFDIPEDDIFNEFVAFIGFFSKKSIPHFIEMITHIRRQDRLDALRHRIAYIAQDDVAPIADFLKSDDSASLINAIAILGIMKVKGVVSLLQSLFKHPDRKVRSAVVSTLGQAGDLKMVTQFIDDVDVDVRIKALQVLTRMKYPSIFPELLHRIKRKDFLNFEFVEQKEYFNCLVNNGESNLAKHLKKILFKWLLFGRKRYRIMRKLAAAGLTQIQTDEAREILQQGIASKNKDIRAACEMALK